MSYEMFIKISDVSSLLAVSIFAFLISFWKYIKPNFNSSYVKLVLFSGTYNMQEFAMELCKCFGILRIIQSSCGMH